MARSRQDEPAGDAVAARYRRIYEEVAAIPRGRVASYGEIAARAGMPRGARLVGRALAGCPDSLPWHRVLNAAGRSSLAPGSAAWREQLRRLAREGIVPLRGRVPRRFFHSPAEQVDELLWGPSSAPARALRGDRRP